uniref:Uncharacterized protein n=1 Tax=Parascaris univalens TaxID=6257 RepID=A0A915AK22_PARUN
MISQTFDFSIDVNQSFKGRLLLHLQVSKVTKESVEVETDISLSCSRSDDPLVSIERADEEFWRLVTESFSEKMDEMRRENVKLEEEIRSLENKKAKLEEARDELIAVVESAISGEGPT